MSGVVRFARRWKWTITAIALIPAALALGFWAWAGWWWLAQHMAWWTWSLLSMGAVFARTAGQALIGVYRKRRRKP